MLSPTLQEGLERYGIGPKLRALRLRKKMGLVELGEHTGLSAAMLSKIERGRLFPTLPTLLRISMVFSVGLDHFFGEDRQDRRVAIVRRAERQRFPEQPGSDNAAFSFECLDFPATDRRMNAYLAEFKPLEPEQVHDHEHEGSEFIFVMRGRLGLRVESHEYLLGAGDSVYFDSGLPHGYRQIGKQTCTAIVVTVP